MNKFVSILEAIGKDFEKGLTDVVKYLPLADTVAGFLFPAAVAPLAAATSTADLLQNAISTVEQKYAASGAQSGTGVQKSAEVLTLTNSAITTMLTDPTVQKGLSAAGITVDATYVQNMINAVVGFLNLQGVAVSPSVPAPAAGATA